MKKGFYIFLNLIYSLMTTLAFIYLNSVEKGSVLIYLTAAGMTAVFYFLVKERKNVYETAAALILSFLLLLGKYIVYIDEVDGIELYYRMAVTFAGSYLFIRRFIGFIFDRAESCKASKKEYSTRRLFIIAFVVMFVSWLPFWIAEYPGSFGADTLTQIRQALGKGYFNSANPLIHTLLIRYLYEFFSLFFKDVNVALSCVELVMMAFNSLIYSYVIVYIYKKTDNIYLYTGSLFFYSLVSYNAFYNSTISKDSAYAALLSLFAVCIDRFICTGKIKDLIVLSLTGVLYAQMRSNGYYSLVILFVFVLLIIRKNFMKKMLAATVLIIALATVVKIPLANTIINNLNDDVVGVTQVQSHHLTRKYVFYGSFLTVVPFQQVANVVVHDRELTEKEEWLIELYLSIDRIKNAYNPILIDPLYTAIENKIKPARGEVNDIEYVKLWIELGLKYPRDYIQAYVNMNRYYFYPNRYVTMYVTGTADNNLGITDGDIVSDTMSEKIEKLYDLQHQIPVVGSLYSPGVTTFVLIAALFYQLKKKQYSQFVALMPVFANFLILMAFVPLNDEFRYIYPVASALPLIVGSFFVRKENA